jgi:membrane fusion protein, heavy metal efflux system
MVTQSVMWEKMKKIIIGLCALLVIGLFVALNGGISSSRSGTSDGHGTTHNHESNGDGREECEDKGPHGGKLLREGDFALEIVTYEKGGRPHFRVYASHNGRPIDPGEIKVSIRLERLGDNVEAHELKPGPGFLFGSREIDKPLSFFVKASARWQEEEFEWEYSQYEGRLTLPEELARQMGIQTALAQPKTIRSFLELPGEIAFNADRVSHLVPRVSGFAVESRKNLGDTVRSGEVVAVIESRELGEARSRYLVAMEREKLASYNFERAQNLLEKGTIPEKEYLTVQKAHLEEKIERVSAARKLVALGLTEAEITGLDNDVSGNLTRFALKAAFDGVVVKKHLSPGEWVKEDAELFVIADLSSVWVEIVVYADDVASVRLGRKALVNDDRTGDEVEGTVSYLGPLMGEESRTARARVVIPNPDGRWRPGQFVKIKLVTDEVLAPVVVHNEAIQSYKNNPVVFARHDDQYEARPVELGLADSHWTEVRKGLESGQRYASRNSFILKSELGKRGMSHQH